MSPAPAWPHGPRTNVCVSIAEADPASLHSAFARIAGADLVEIRLDALGDDALDREVLRALVDACPVPVGFTLRPTWQGGGYTGPESDRQTFLEQAAAIGAAFVDVELDAEFVVEMVEAAACPVIVSHHWEDPRPADFDERVRRARTIGASVVKLVGTAAAPSDAIPLLRAGRQLHESGQPSACFCMGEAGRASRLLAAARGAALIYAAVESGREVAAGQWPVQRLVQEMGVGSWKPHGELFGLIGDPIEHSLSPAVFNAVFRQRGVEAAYLPVPGADLDETLALLREAGFRGVSVTMPFKQRMAARCDHKDFVVETMGAANTVVFDDDGWSAYNTDGTAVVDALAAVRDLAGTRTVIVGAGGAARAAAAALTQAGAEVTIVNRTPERAAQAAEIVGAASGPIGMIEGAGFDVIVNATPVGMDPPPSGATARTNTASAGVTTTRGPDGAAEEQTPFPTSWLRGREVVLDMVYRPRQTPLLRAARQRGCSIVEGLEMFIRQAAAQYGHLTGDRRGDSLSLMRAAAAATLSRDRSAAQDRASDDTTRV